MAVKKSSAGVPIEKDVNIPKVGIQSKLIWYHVVNFAAFDDETINFPEGKGILKINGYNDTGKSALLRGLGMLMLGKFQKDQQKFVQDGKDFFELSVGFNDGVVLFMRRYAKRAGSGVFYELRKDDKVLYTTKEGNALTAARTIPDCFKRYLGLVTTKVADLNYRDRNDAPLLTGTSDRVNNDALNDVLKFTAISDATDSLRREINQKNSEFNTAKGSYDAMDALVVGLRGVTEEAVTDAESLWKKTKLCGQQMRSLDKIREVTENIDTTAEDKKADLGKVSDSTGILLGRINTLENIGSAIDASYKSHVDSLCRNDLDALSKKADEVSSKYGSLKDLVAGFKSLAGAVATQNSLQESLKDKQDRLNAMNEEIKAKGGKLVKCPNCGQQLAVGIKDGE